MTRTKRGFIAKKRRKKILKQAKGFKGSHSKLFRTANQQTMKASLYSFSDRKKKKNQIKKIWIVRINAKSRKYGQKYNLIVSYLKKTLIIINKKLFSEMNVRITKFYPTLLSKTFLTKEKS